MALAARANRRLVLRFHLFGSIKRGQSRWIGSNRIFLDKRNCENSPWIHPLKLWIRTRFVPRQAILFQGSSMDRRERFVCRLSFSLSLSLSLNTHLYNGLLVPLIRHFISRCVAFVVERRFFPKLYSSRFYNFWIFESISRSTSFFFRRFAWSNFRGHAHASFVPLAFWIDKNAVNLLASVARRWKFLEISVDSTFLKYFSFTSSSTQTYDTDIQIHIKNLPQNWSWPWPWISGFFCIVFYSSWRWKNFSKET